MAKSEPKTQQDQISANEMSSEDGLDPDDYVFIVGADGKMKSVIFPPESTLEYSRDLLKVFSVFGVDDPDQLLNNYTIH
jgi:hypothetical protein